MVKDFAPPIWLAVVVAVAAGWYFASAGGGLSHEPPFADEAAILGQTYFYRLAKAGDFAHPDWASHAAYDHQPLYKYWIGAALDATGKGSAIPTSLDDWKKWMAGGVRAPEVDADLLTARAAMTVGAGLAAAFVYWTVARQAGSLAGMLAAVALASSPLVFVHGRRAMIDLTAQGFAVGVLAAAAGLATARTSRGWLGWICLTILLGALGPLAKWNAAVGCITVTVVAGAALVVGSWNTRLRALALLAAVAVAAGLFVAGDPYYWSVPDKARLAEILAKVPERERPERQFLANATPWQRAQHAFEYRRGSLAGAAQQFPNDYLQPTERPIAIVAQGLGRWTLGNRRYTVEEANKPRPQRTITDDWLRAAIMLPLVAIGWIAAVRGGWRQRSAGAFPTAWLLAAWPVVDLATTLPNLTLDWDRYYLSTVCWSSVLAACGVASVLRGFTGALKLPARELNQT